LLLSGFIGCSAEEAASESAQNEAAQDASAKGAAAGPAADRGALVDCSLPYAAEETPASADEIDPTVCFRGQPPGAGEPVKQLAMPFAECCTKSSPIFFKPGQPMPAPSLVVELGTSNPQTGAFVPYEQGQWLRIVHGKQGGIHVDAAIRVVLPGEDRAKVKMQIFATGHFECKESAVGNSPIIWVRPDAELDEGYTNASPVKPGVEVRFPVTGFYWYQYCGIWLDLRAAVRHPDSGAWGHTSRMVRLFDGVMPKGTTTPP